ncbi:MAG TPA: hypothetical protein VGI95_03655 [Caulobacteraceae bacterium]|jgi:hypothetical protein
MADLTRVLVPVDSQDAQAFRLALGYAENICERTGSNDISLLVHTKHQLDHTSLAQFLGPAALRALDKGTVSLPSGKRLHANTMKTLRYSARNAVLLVYYAEPKILDFADGLEAVGGIVAVPDLPGEADGWVARWGAIVHGQATAAPATLIGDAVFVGALETLSKVVNLSTGLGHPRDRQMADQILRILRAKGHADQSENIKSWAIRHGWHPEHAAELERLARKIWALKNKPALSNVHDPHGRYQRWRDEAGA